MTKRGCGYQGKNKCTTCSSNNKNQRPFRLQIAMGKGIFLNKNFTVIKRREGYIN